MEMSEVEWKESLKQTEKDVSNFIFKTFEAKPLGVFALSQMLPKKTNKKMQIPIKNVLEEKFKKLK